MSEGSTYKENPKTKGSGIVACIPQTGNCPQNCSDCFFQSGRSYLEPLDDNLPNMPSPEEAAGRIVRVNDGNDSSVHRQLVMQDTAGYPMRFYNTSIPTHLSEFNAPVVLTLNPKDMTDQNFHMVEPPPNLMFVRVRVNAWNALKNTPSLIDQVVNYYSIREIPVILTFMAYHHEKDIDPEFRSSYVLRKRTQNSYYAITTAAWEMIMSRYKFNKWIYSCGKVEGELGVSGCRHCGNCLREYFATMERLRNN